MARKRMIAPSFWSDEKLGEQCSALERLLFLGLISNADDEGIGRGNPKYLKSQIFPYDDLTVDEFKKMLLNLSKHKLIILYQHEGQAYYMVKNFLKYQTINKPTPSDFPKPEKSESTDTGTLPDNYGSTTGTLPPKRKEEKLKEDKLREENILPGAETAPDSTPAVITLPLNDKTEYAVKQTEVDEWVELYPAVDIMQELRNMKGWLNANPGKRKTRTGVHRFINGWLSKEQNRGGSSPPNQGSPSKFQNYTQRTDIDYAQLEREALEKRRRMCGEDDEV